MFEVGEGYKLRNGMEAKVYAVYPDSIHGAYWEPTQNKWFSITWDKDGLDEDSRHFDLLPKKKVGWINIYSDAISGVPYTGDIHSSKEKAIEAIKGSPSLTSTIKIEYHEGQVDDE